MDYFKILNLNREPFSNSPEPEFFFPSTKHLACLQQLELAIRLRRGLNVVMGDVGTGKTTLCRQLILRFTESEEDRNDIQTHLLLDPSFTDSHEFLAAVALTFGLPQTDGKESGWQMKESIKDYLFRKGVDENKTIVLIIDEGQKIPDFCLEILREFLNYETNENKLLQIVIFAQNEFKQTLAERENFADRVNQYYYLRPLNFRETRTMIRFRIARAGNPDEARPLFTLPGLWAIYRATGGYPRKIITLCHQVVLTLIIQNQVRAGWFLVRSTAGRLLPDVIRKERWATAGLLLVLILSVLAFIFFVPGQLDFSRLPFLTTLIVAKPTPALRPAPTVEPAFKASGPATRPEAIQAASAPAASAKTPPGETAQAKPDEESKPEPAIPDQLGSLKIREGGTVFRLLQEIYGNSGTARYRAVIRANPHISDMNMVRAGETIHFPAIPVKSNPLTPGKKWVQVAKKSSLDEAYRLYKRYPADQPAVRLIPARSRREGLTFLIVMKAGFYSEEEAKDAIGKLPPPLAEGAEIANPPGEGAVYFAN